MSDDGLGGPVTNLNNCERLSRAGVPARQSHAATARNCIPREVDSCLYVEKNTQRDCSVVVCGAVVGYTMVCR